MHKIFILLLPVLAFSILPSSHNIYLDNEAKESTKKLANLYSRTMKHLSKNDLKKECRKFSSSLDKELQEVFVSNCN